MPDLIRLVGDQPIWPYSVAQLRRDESNRSFSDSPSDVDLAWYNCYRVQKTPWPDHDPANEKVVELFPAELGGAWFQRWDVVEMSDEEKEAYYRAAHPPQWLEFGAVVQELPEIKQLMDVGLEVASPLALAIAVGLGKAADGDPRVFLGAWSRAVAGGLVSAELIIALRSLAVQYDLPAEFVAGLGGQP